MALSPIVTRTSSSRTKLLEITHPTAGRVELVSPSTSDIHGNTAPFKAGYSTSLLMQPMIEDMNLELLFKSTMIRDAPIKLYDEETILELIIKVYSDSRYDQKLDDGLIKHNNVQL